MTETNIKMWMPSNGLFNVWHKDFIPNDSLNGPKKFGQKNHSTSISVLWWKEHK